jgi:HlyD family secretion protein
MPRSVVRLVLILLVVAGALGGWNYWLTHRTPPLPEGIVSGNGRIEAVQVDIATKFTGRVTEVLVKEGDLLEKGQIVAKMDTLQLEASLAQAQAQTAQAEQGVAQSKANIVKCESDLKLAERELARGRPLVAGNAISAAEMDSLEARRDAAVATLDATKAALRTQEFAVKAAQAQVAQIQTQLDDAILYSPTRGRVLYRLAETGEVLQVGGKVVTLLDMSDIYMEIYLPAAAAVRTAIGSDARVVFDVAPEYAAEAKVSFVAPEAQFTPKQVETASERDKLMFRVKVQLPPDRVEPYLDRIKTGIRGVAYIQLDPAVAWPAALEHRFPDLPEELDRMEASKAAAKN